MVLWVVVFGIIAVLVVKKYKSKTKRVSTPSEPMTPPAPPTLDALILGCNTDCGYYGGYRVVNGEAGCYCMYVKRNVQIESECAFANEHTKDELRDTIFSDNYVSIKDWRK